MTNKRTTRHALFTSLLSLLLCVSMLVGTTFAWFTDSVTSGQNKIIAGNLDIEMEYSMDLTNWKDASAANDIFVAPAGATKGLWEPGHTEVAYLKITNAGTLALKYRLQVSPFAETVGKNEKGEDIKLSDILMFAATEPSETAPALYTRETAQKAARDAKQAVKLTQYTTGEITMEPKAVQYIALVVYMPEEVGNEANYRGDAIPTIEFALNLVATQLTSEKDSFGPDYDKEATYPAANTVYVPAGTTTATKLGVNGNAIYVEIPAGSAEGDYMLEVTNKTVTTEAGNTTVAYDISLYHEGQKVSGVSYPVYIYVGKKLDVSKVTHNGNEITYAYDPFSGYVSFVTDSFSPFAVTYKAHAEDESYPITNAKMLADALKEGGEYKLVGDIQLSNAVEVPAGVAVELDLNGKAITGTKGRDADNNRIHVIVNNGILTIKDGTVKSAGNDGGSAICNNAGATLTIEDVTLYGAPQSDPVYEAGVSKPFPSYAVNNYGKAVVNGATVKSYHGAIATGDNGVTVINDADIDVGLGQSTGITSYIIYSYGNAKVTVNDGKFAFTKQEVYVNGGNTFCELGTNPIMINGGNYTGTSFSTGAGREYVIKGGTFDVDPSAYVVPGYKVTNNGDGSWTVALSVEDAKELITNAGNGDVVSLPVGDYSIPSMSGKEGVTIEGVEGTVIGGENATTGFGSSNFGKNNTYKNLTFEGSDNGARWTYANGGTNTFENCTFKGDVYGFHMDQSNGSTLIFNNCTFVGFNAFAGDLVKVIFNNCEFLHSGYYGHTNIWSVAEFNNCTWGDKTSVSPAQASAKLFFNGAEESYHHEYVGSAESLKDFAKTVNEGDTWKGQKVVLVDNIDLKNEAWTPIGDASNNFKGIFDGNGKTIKNLNVSMAGKSNAGLFGQTSDGEVKNLTVENATVIGRLNVGVVAGTPYTSKYSNITVKGHIEVSGMAYVGGVGGKNAYANWDKITVEADDTSFVKADSVEDGTAYRTYVGGVIGFMGEGGHKVSNVNSNIDVIGSTCDVGGIVGIAHYGNTFENITCSGDVTLTGAAEAADAEELGGIAGVWHNGGSNVTFTNCKFTGKLTANITEGVYLNNNTITGKAYSSSGTGKLIIDGAEVIFVASAEALQAALDTAPSGAQIWLDADITGDVVVKQPGDKDVDVIIDGQGFKYDGQIKIHGGSDFDGETDDSLVIKNVNFETVVADRDFIWSADSSNGSFWRYAHNVTVENCTFTAAEAAVNTTVGARFQQAYNIKLVGCTATNLHSLLQAESCGSTVTVDGCEIINGKNGVSLNNTMNAVVRNTKIQSVADGGYGIRHKGQVEGYALTVENCEISAFVPVLIRNMTGKNYTADFVGTNKLTATNDFGYEVVLSAGDWDNDAAAPAAPTGTYTLTGADSFNVFK